MDGQYWKGDRTMSTNEWLLTSDFWQFLEPWHGRWYEYEIFIASCTDNIYDLENERWLLRDIIDHVGIYGSRVAEGLSAFNVGLVIQSEQFFIKGVNSFQFDFHVIGGAFCQGLNIWNLKFYRVWVTFLKSACVIRKAVTFPAH